MSNMSNTMGNMSKLIKNKNYGYQNQNSLQYQLSNTGNLQNQYQVYSQ